MPARLLFTSLLMGLVCPALAASADSSQPGEQMALWQAQVTAAECRFAASMASRDLAAFESMLSQHTLFFGGPEPLSGRAAVLAGWRGFFVKGPAAPFSWAPDRVTVSADGSLAHSSGPVRSARGELLQRFNSVWRQEAPGVWRVVIDNGSPLTEAERLSEAKRLADQGAEPGARGKAPDTLCSSGGSS